MQRLSSNLTLFFKFFIPVFWLVFFGAFTAASLLYKYDHVGNIPASTFKIGVILFYLSGVIMFVFTLMKLVRVEANDSFVYVTNYFKAARYPFHNIEKFSERHFLSFLLVSIYFRQPGQFGKRVTFIATRKAYKMYWEQYSELYEELNERL